MCHKQFTIAIMMIIKIEEYRCNFVRKPMDAFSWARLHREAHLAWRREVRKTKFLAFSDDADLWGLTKVFQRYCESSLFGGFEDIGSIKRVETDLANPTVMVYESSKFLGEIPHRKWRNMANCPNIKLLEIRICLFACEKHPKLFLHVSIKITMYHAAL